MTRPDPAKPEPAKPEPEPEPDSLPPMKLTDSELAFLTDHHSAAMVTVTPEGIAKVARVGVAVSALDGVPGLSAGSGATRAAPSTSTTTPSGSWPWRRP